MEKIKNIEKLKLVGILGEIRLKYGAESVNDTSKDDIINEQTNYGLVEDWCEYTFGSSRFWRIMHHIYSELNQIEPN